ncbi:MAG TPA: hypothetical protein PLK77_01760 [Pyrinomonadaceae bacterium]|nr:hypothetical protein [Pyrinomonadaceae bacterium]
MDILNSGSFVTLDNREKIDQLIYTARELATEVSRAEGFQNGGQTNHQLGLEMWKGTEYLCRSHEEANIRNLFLSKFLERLREIEKERGTQTKSVVARADSRAFVPVSKTEPVSIQTPAITQARPEQLPPNEARDEYLGVLSGDDAENKQSSYADECVPECEADIEAIVDRLDNETAAPDDDHPSGEIGALAVQPETEAVSDVGAIETAADGSEAVERGGSNDVPDEEARPDLTEPVEPESIPSIVLAEKEPYNLDACTITAVIQVLPEASGIRKCVVSLRTHDFAPMVTVSEGDAGQLLPHVSAALNDALARYRIDLPAKAADKLKKEKPAAKKQTKSGAKPVKAVTVPSGAATIVAASPVTNPETDQGQRGLFAS